jgi:hypothetical protein
MTIHVNRWMKEAQPGVVGSRATRLADAAGAVNAAGTRLAEVLAEAGGVLGWVSDGALEARRHLTRADGQVGRFRDLLDEAAEALRALDRSIGEHQPEIHRLLNPRPLPGNRGPGPPFPEAELRPHVDALALADRTARDRLQNVVGQLRALGATNLEDDWVGTAVPADVGRLLGKYGVVEDDRERAILDKVMLLPTGPRGDAELRALLAELTPEELADFLARHPDVARRLSGGLSPASVYAPGSPEAALAEVLDSTKNLPPKERIAAIRAAFARMMREDPQRAAQLALLYPEVVGNLDGAPLELRMVANRVKVGIALDDERAKRVDVQRANQEFEPNAKATAGNDKRITYYEKLLYEEVKNPTYKPGSERPETMSHQVLFFDGAGDGRIAEMWGTLDANTRNVGVFVPGTTADMSNFESDSNKMRDVALADPNRDTVTVTWLGVDMPDAIVPDAPFNHYAETGGPALRDFMWGLDVPADKRTTAIGHSYGGAVVGVADREGLEVDNVLHIASAGAGKGVDSVDDYPSGTATKRYSMTAPGDPIGLVQGAPHAGRIGHGADPDEMDGVVHLDTGRYDPDDPSHDGEMIQGRDAHSAVTRARGSTAWNNMVGVVTGGEVTLYTPPHTSYNPYGPGETTYPYERPGFEGPKVDIE